MMTSAYNLCIIKPNKSIFSETFIEEHINRLSGRKKVIYGGAFPLYDHHHRLLIRSKIQVLSYLFQKRILGRQRISVRTKALVNYFKKESIDVVFAEYGMVGALVTDACELANIPLIIHFHGADAHHRDTVEKYREQYKRAFQYCSGIIAVSKDMIQTLMDLGAPKNKIYHIPCGVNTEHFLALDTLSESADFLAIGRFVEKKSPISVVHSFEKVLLTLPESKLWMVGSGPLFTTVQKYVKEKGLGGKIFLTGVLNQDQIKSLMRKVRCFVQHSVTASSGDMEGSPVTIIEASASGLPVVSTRHAGIKEAVIEGVTGFLVDEYDIDGMADKMIEVVSSPERALSMGKAGRLHILKNYAVEDQVRKIDQIIQRAIHNRV
jgi:colanic acid/amylovoran biosynthesis glycosyltransferase